jgi:hypothetical protein
MAEELKELDIALPAGQDRFGQPPRPGEVAAAVELEGRSQAFGKLGQDRGPQSLPEVADKRRAVP